jgi:starch synthase
MVVLQHPTGNANVRNALIAFWEADILANYVTSVSVREKIATNRAIPECLRRWLVRRAYPDGIARRTKTYPYREAIRLLQQHSALARVMWKRVQVEDVYLAIDRFAAGIITSARGVQAVYGYDGAALKMFEAAKRKGMTTIYEMPTPYWRMKATIVESERTVAPIPAQTMGPIPDGSAHWQRKDEELMLADVIIVPSSFVAASLEKAPFEISRVKVIPYGFPQCDPGESRSSRQRAPLRLLYVGNLGQAKGLSYLIGAAKQLASVAVITIIGSKPSSTWPELDKFLTENRYLGTMPHQEVLKEMREQDVLILPTLYEGMALVILEAMSRGLVVITTPNAGVSEVICSGSNGFIVPIRDANAIAYCVAQLAEDPAFMERVQGEAIRTAQRWTWGNYRSRIADVVESIIN